MRSLTFIVGTGRSGSTVLSEIINAHPDILSLNELLASLLEPDHAFPGQPVTGEEFWRILSEPNAVFDTLIRSGTPLPEFLYIRKPGRYSATTTGIPALSLMVLPHLADDPDQALDDLARDIRPWPARPVAQHYRALFDLLRARFGGRAVIERSGYSLHWIPRLNETFPEARFVHLHRNGPDCAVSMSRHPGYRTISLLRDVLDHAAVPTLADLTEQHVAALPPDLAALLGAQFDPALIRDREMPVTRFGALWSELICEGVAFLDEVPPGRRMTLSYEDVLDDPGHALGRLAHFVGIEPTPAWLGLARSRLDPARRDKTQHLSAEERTALDQACEAGRRALESAGRAER
ncbi:sulfotransferase family protein [Streptomyces litchfieldiae]|uniref:Sulfotransferase n=1 Tax=Streptomyces litchfieldiae TaxID=3075543 RepID=A0ABU2MRY2_9ACTN|nr:sulfotransferase [Streptomyces sp. DSM 44938]MDT0344389.1 sulfotransferase [Streptomyces sp. DSM 44938]